jgi:hypothetical protein
MAGLYDRITISDDNVQVHFLIAGLKDMDQGAGTSIYQQPA